MEKSEEVLKFAAKLSKEFYGKPLVIVTEFDLLRLAQKVLDPSDYRVAIDFEPFRLCAETIGKGCFGVRGCGMNYEYTFDHAKEVYEESKVNDPIYDCLLITAMKDKKNVYVNPFGTDEVVNGNLR